jgi:hypothetical protein
VETRQGNKLELVTHLAELLLKRSNRGFIQVAPPVERRRAVVRQPLAGVFFVDALSELARLAEVGLRSLAPD